MGMMVVMCEIKFEVGMGNIFEIVVCVLFDCCVDVFFVWCVGVDVWLVNFVYFFVLCWIVDWLIEDGDSWSEEVFEVEFVGFDVVLVEVDDEFVDVGVVEVGDDFL